ncbi:MAG: hypothetical protein ACKVP0_27730 [Pirellulaceae bacterium]
MSLKEIETEIARLPATEVAELLSWLAEHHARLWDEQIERDLGAGRLDGLLDDVADGMACPL